MKGLALKLSNGEKLTLMMLSEIYEHMKIKGEIDPKFVKSAINNNQTWGISWKYPGIPFDEEETPAIVDETQDILEMFSMIEYSYSKLSDAEKARIKIEAEPFGQESDIKFQGFDGNNESKYLVVAHFLVDDLERFEEFKGRIANTHFPSIDTYRRMLPAYKVEGRATGAPFSATQIIKILKEITHPDYRK